MNRIADFANIVKEGGKLSAFSEKDKRDTKGWKVRKVLWSLHLHLLALGAFKQLSLRTEEFVTDMRGN